MRSRAPVLAAVTVVAVVQALAERGTPAPVAHAPRVAAPRSGPDDRRAPAPRPAAHRRRRLAALTAGAVGAPVLALALPAALPSAASVDPVPAAAEPAVAGPADLPRDTAGLTAAREQVLSEREAATQASRARRTPAQPPAPPATGGGPATASPPPATAPRATAPPPAAAAGATPPAPAAPAAGPETVAPVAAPVGSEYGYRWGRLHAGLDFPAPHGTPVLAVADGVVEQAGPAGGYGNLVTVRHADGTVTAYGHMRVIAVASGQAVEAGQVIAEVGSEGRSTGPHLHFEVRTPQGRHDPRPWLAQRGVSV